MPFRSSNRRPAVFSKIQPEDQSLRPVPKQHTYDCGWARALRPGLLAHYGIPRGAPHPGGLPVLTRISQSRQQVIRAGFAWGRSIAFFTSCESSPGSISHPRSMNSTIEIPALPELAQTD